MRLRVVIACVAFATLVACAGLGGVPSRVGIESPVAPNASFADPAAERATAVEFSIVVTVPAHGRLSGKPADVDDAPDWVSPGTEALSMTLVNPKTKKAVGKTTFWILSSKTKGCSGGSLGSGKKKPTPLTCTFQKSVDSGDYDAELTGYAGTTEKSPIIEAATVALKLDTSKNTLKVSLGGQPRYVYLQLAQPYPPIGVRAKIAVHVLAADAWGFIIVGAYDVPLQLKDSDTTGATKLSRTTLTSSTEASSAVLAYNGSKLAKSAIVTVSAKSAPHKAAALFSPGASALEAYPAALFIAALTSVVIEPVGTGIVPPYRASLRADTLGNPACAGFVTVSGSGPDFLVSPVALGACAIVFADSAGHTLSVPVLVQSEVASPGNPTPGPSPTPTPVVKPTSTPTATPSATPTPNAVVANPITVTLCPSSGSNACAQDAASLAISQVGFSGSFSESDTCSATLAVVSPVSASGPSASYTVTGGSTLGTCTATFTGANAEKTTVTIDVTQSGWIINDRHHATSNAPPLHR